MVSGFFTSPCDHWRMSSPLARPMRNSSKKLTSSKGTPFPGLGYCCLSCGRGARRPAPIGGPAGGRSDVLDAGGLAAGQVDAQLLRGPEHLVVGVAQLDRLPVAGEHLDVEAQRLQLLEQHLERLRDEIGRASCRERV